MIEEKKPFGVACHVKIYHFYTETLWKHNASFEAALKMHQAESLAGIAFEWLLWLITLISIPFAWVTIFSMWKCDLRILNLSSSCELIE